MPLTDAALIAFLRRQADIAGSTDRGAVLLEDAARLDWLEATRGRLLWGPDCPEWSYYAVTIRAAIDAAMKAKENTPMAESNPQPAPSCDWPQAGDVGYYVGDFDDTEDSRSLDEIRMDLVVFFVRDPEDNRLLYVGATADTGGSSGNGWRSLAAQFYEPGSDNIRRTLAESLRETAREAREYACQCLEKVARLEKLAAEAEEGNADGH